MGNYVYWGIRPKLNGFMLYALRQTGVNHGVGDDRLMWVIVMDRGSTWIVLRSY